jgi:hypothetical protein
MKLPKVLEFYFTYFYKKLILTLSYLIKEIFMSMELKTINNKIYKDEVGYYIEYYEPSNQIDFKETFLTEEKKYENWLKIFKKSGYRLVNIIRHPDMNQNILIHYFAD